MPETRRRMRIGPNARRGGNIEDRRGEDRRFQVLERQDGMFVTPRQHDERVYRALRGRNRSDGSRVTDYGQRGSRPMSRGRQGSRPGTTSTMGRS
jgi:hypothetical protein